MGSSLINNLYSKQLTLQVFVNFELANANYGVVVRTIIKT